MRIISGKARGIRLNAPEGETLRPTEDRVKESLFGSLGNLAGAVVVDLFAGTGALGLEALSRGAARVVFVEKNPEHVGFIESNLAAVRKSVGDVCGETQIIQADVANAHRQLCALDLHPDFVLADPPYHASEQYPYCSQELVMDSEFAQWAVFPVVLCLEHGTDVKIPWADRELSSPWFLLKSRSFGIRTVSFAKRKNPME